MGVGDVALSYAYDGDRLKKWHESSSDYGLKWQKGDVIGCCFDGDKRTLSFWKNGVDMGVAFSDVEQGPGIAFFPAASMSTNETIRFNFGDAPFYFPVAEFAAVSLTSQQFANILKR
jgi:Kip1 ubiquitination-promoting complex protein 1